MAADPRFSFDFADLRRRTPGLGVVPAAHEGLPPDAELVAAEPRPGWIEPLPAFCAGGEPLRVDLARGGAFAALLLRALAGLFAAAGAECGLEVRAWSRGFAAGPPGLASIPPRAHACLVPCELAPDDVLAAATVLRLLPAADVWLVLSRSVPRLDAAFGLAAEPFASVPRERVRRLAGLDASELAALAAGRVPSLGLGRFSRRCLGLAADIARAYRRSAAGAVR